MKFTAKELRELGSLAGWDVQISQNDLAVDPVSATEIAAPQTAANARNIQFLRECSLRSRSSDRTIEFRFLRTPVEVRGDCCVSGVVFGVNSLTGEPFQQRAVPTGQTEFVDAQTIFSSIGYGGIPFPGLPFDRVAGVVPNSKGRVIGELGVCPRTYVTGWIKRGPTGIIGTNRVDSIETVASLVADRPRMVGREREDNATLSRLLVARDIRPVSFNEWRHIDIEELRRGQRLGRVRSKITSVQELVTVAAAGSQTGVGRGGETNDQPALMA
jgi:ferredoxin--NADP+ reductase